MSRKNNLGLGLASKLDLPARFPSLSQSRIHVACSLSCTCTRQTRNLGRAVKGLGQSQLQSPETTARHPHARELPMTSHVHRA